jgi:hypothetical protein
MTNIKDCLDFEIILTTKTTIDPIQEAIQEGTKLLYLNSITINYN